MGVGLCTRGQDVFRFYILFLLGFMSGIAAGQGSRFMNGKRPGEGISWVRGSWEAVGPIEAKGGGRAHVEAWGTHLSGGF